MDITITIKNGDEEWYKDLFSAMQAFNVMQGAFVADTKDINNLVIDFAELEHASSSLAGKAITQNLSIWSTNQKIKADKLSGNYR